jgi:LmbE family N-acetylglucosaminyl deacetylase
MPTDRLPTPERVLVVAAHPDDIEFGAAGTVARWIDEGARVRYLLVTRGDKGSDDPSADPHQLGVLREAEQRRPTGRWNPAFAFASASRMPSAGCSPRS